MASAADSSAESAYFTASASGEREAMMASARLRSAGGSASAISRHSFLAWTSGPSRSEPALDAAADAVSARRRSSGLSRRSTCARYSGQSEDARCGASRGAFSTNAVPFSLEMVSSARRVIATRRAPESAHQQWGESPHRTEHWLSVAEGNCVAEGRGGEQPEANDQSIIKKMMNSIRPDALASLRRKGEAQDGSRPERESGNFAT